MIDKEKFNPILAVANSFRDTCNRFAWDLDKEAVQGVECIVEWDEATVSRSLKLKTDYKELNIYFVYPNGTKFRLFRKMWDNPSDVMFDWRQANDLVAQELMMILLSGKGMCDVKEIIRGTAEFIDEQVGFRGSINYNEQVLRDKKQSITSDGRKLNVSIEFFLKDKSLGKFSCPERSSQPERDNVAKEVGIKNYDKFTLDGERVVVTQLTNGNWRSVTFDGHVCEFSRDEFIRHE